MDFRQISRDVESGLRLKAWAKARGVTGRGDRLWTEAEDQIIRQNASLLVSAIRKLLPYRRSLKAVEARRKKLGLAQRSLKPWTTTEDKILKAHIDKLSYVAIAKLLPGRSRNSVQGRAWYLGYRDHWRPCPKPKKLPIYDAIRTRCHEDGMSMATLDRELRTGKYFQDNYGRRINWKKIAKAVDFFGGELAINWKDE